ncbi:MAG: DUF4244 domain-containing protein [Streptosporangiaceae bacterium]
MRRVLALCRVLLRVPARVARGDRGMTTAEYAVGTVAACGFAALLLKILTSDRVRQLLGGIVERALHLPF